MVLDSTTALLEQLGQTVVATADPADAIELASSSIASDQFDVAILDLTLPGKIGGAEVASRISEFSPDTKLVVMSGYHSNPVLNNFQKFGFSAILSKPFRADE